MRSLFRHMRPQIKTVVLIFVFLILQAICDLSLPYYTASLIDVGIQGSGIAYAVPDILYSDSFEIISMQMEPQERALWQKSYTSQSGIYTLNPDADLKALDEVFTVPLAQTAMIAQGKPATRDEIAAMGDATVHSMAIALVKAEYQALGIDLYAMQKTYLLHTGGKMLIMALGMALTAVLSSLFAAKVGAAIGHDLRGQIFRKVMHFSGAEISKFSTASLITRSTGDVQQIQLVITMVMRMMAYAPLMGLGGIIMVVRTHSGMEWIILVAIGLLLLLVGTLMGVAMPKFKIMQTLVDRVNLLAREILTGLSVIRAFGREQVEQDRFDVANRTLTGNMLFTNRAMSLMMPLMMLLMNSVSVLIVWVSAQRIDVGALGIGDMTAFITYTMMIVMSFLMLSFFSFMLPRATVASERIDEVLQTESSILDAQCPANIVSPKGVVRFEHTSFQYPGAADNTLTDINFTALPGQTTAIIGSTGCGKSTLVNLLPRFYDVTGGCITIDDVDIRALSLEELRGLIGFAPQKGILFSGTIASNIAYGAPKIGQEGIEQAADIAQASSFIEEKHDKFESPIAQGGSNVSGGQKQRLSIARAIARAPRIYIFDDTFSALDFKTDAALRRALGPKVKESTVFIVAQRISTILHADQILVLNDEGELVGKGTHQELLEACQTYQQIARSQLSEAELGGKGDN